MLSLALAKNLPPKAEILCLGAHSDDIEIGCGGTLLSLLEQRSDVVVRWVVFSARGLRKDEAIDSAEAFLAQVAQKKIKTHDFRDGYFPGQREALKDQFEAMAKNIQPTLIFTHCENDKHQDHRLVQELTWNTFRNHCVLEYEIPKYDADLGQPNSYVELDTDILDKKCELILKHFKTQQSKAWFDSEVFKSLARIRGLECQSRYAEAFYAKKIKF